MKCSHLHIKSCLIQHFSVDFFSDLANVNELWTIFYAIQKIIVSVEQNSMLQLLWIYKSSPSLSVRLDFAI